MTCRADASASATRATPRPPPRSSAGRISAGVKELNIPARLAGIFFGLSAGGTFHTAQEEWRAVKIKSLRRLALAFCFAGALIFAAAQDAGGCQPPGMLRLLPADTPERC